MKQFKAILLGAGDRGTNTYGNYALNFPDNLKFIGVAEPNPDRRMIFSKAHDIPDEFQFTDWKDILEKPKFADIVFIATQDQMHEEPAIMAMEKDYHVLLEKPIATTEEACKRIVETSEEKGVILMIAHELRYAELFIKIKELIDSGKVGDIISINHYVNFHYWAYAHGFVRGNWNNRDETTPMILAKACHDFDLICWYAGVKPIKVSSFARGPYL
ncbi:MAG: Gfo/Idh/MocA family oxidoreductase, partial [archaeon]|nr:Gfo/Idh/MocA family oxidoreductase [archaeon]